MHEALNLLHVRRVILVPLCLDIVCQIVELDDKIASYIAQDCFENDVLSLSCVEYNLVLGERSLLSLHPWCDSLSI